MKYYRVKPEFDGKTLYKKCGDRGYRNGYRIPNGYNLIANELVKKSEVYFCFGARFRAQTRRV